MELKQCSFLTWNNIWCAIEQKSKKSFGSITAFVFKSQAYIILHGCSYTHALHTHMHHRGKRTLRFTFHRQPGGRYWSVCVCVFFTAEQGGNKTSHIDSFLPLLLWTLTHIHTVHACITVQQVCIHMLHTRSHTVFTHTLSSLAYSLRFMRH